MRIAVTYENGVIFQHFGRTENFKIYEVEDGKVVSSEVMSTNGEGHGALAGILFNNKINVLICGGIGPGAVEGVSSAGIKVCAGVSGNADGAVQAYIEGRLESSGESNCDHHDEHGAEEGCSCH